MAEHALPIDNLAPDNDRLSREFVRRFDVKRARLINCARAQLARHSAEAEDLVQQVFIRAYTPWMKGEIDPKSLEGYLFRCLNNLIVDVYRQRSRAVIPFSALELSGDGEMVSEPGYARVESKLVVQNLLKKLDPASREILVHYHFETGNARLSAEQLGISVSAFKSRLYRARYQLRKLCSAA